MHVNFQKKMRYSKYIVTFILSVFLMASCHTSSNFEKQLREKEKIERRMRERAEKRARKEAKKREKEERKAAKKKKGKNKDKDDWEEIRTTERFDIEGRTFMDNNAAVRSQFHFKDHNTTSVEMAKQIGIEPCDNREEAEKKVKKLNYIESNRYYLVDNLKHSIPYLGDGAKDLLYDIGRMFQKRLRKQGYREHRIIVTSILRTREDIARLQKVNGNAVRNSAHMYGTTFDLSYSRFNRIDMEGNIVDNTTMANILGEVLSELRDEGRCRVIYERNQHCFHVMSTR